MNFCYSFDIFLICFFISLLNIRSFTIDIFFNFGKLIISLHFFFIDRIAFIDFILVLKQRSFATHMISFKSIPIVKLSIIDRIIVFCRQSSLRISSTSTPAKPRWSWRILCIDCGLWWSNITSCDESRGTIIISQLISLNYKIARWRKTREDERSKITYPLPSPAM